MQTKQGLSQLDKKIIGTLLIAVLVIVLTASLSYFLLGQPNQTPNNLSPTPTPTSTPTPTPTPTSLPTAGVTANINATQSSPGHYLVINGTVTNNSPNTAYDVGLQVDARGYLSGIVFVNKYVLIDMTVPVTSATYSQDPAVGTYPLSTLNPYQSVPVEIEILPGYQGREPYITDINVTLVWSNAP